MKYIVRYLDEDIVYEQDFIGIGIGQLRWFPEKLCFISFKKQSLNYENDFHFLLKMLHN